MPRDAGASAVTSLPARLPAPDDVPAVGATGDGLRTRAGIVVALLAAITGAVTAPLWASLLAGVDSGPYWAKFLVLAIAAGAAQLFVDAPPHERHQTSAVFLVAAALLLPAELIPPIVVLASLAGWLEDRRPWHVHGFDLCRTTLSTLAAWAAARLVLGLGELAASDGARTALAGLAAGATFVALHHGVAAATARLERGRRAPASARFATGSISTGLVLTALGAVVAATWEANAWLLPLALAPLLVVRRSLSVPALEAEARVDPKTGLFNARHFAAQLEEELARAARFERPLSVIMADLDLLREVNNTYGHLAGDAVLESVADVFRAQLRHYDVPARFGGEEFSILLPETPPAQALEIAERIRRAVAERRIGVATSSEPIRVTISIGLAAFPGDGTDANELLHQADLAVYRAKLQGRNRVVAAGCEPLALPLAAAGRPFTAPTDGAAARPTRRYLPAQTKRLFASRRRPRTVDRVDAAALRQAAETKVSLERGDRALRDRSTTALESLSATVDARDSYTAGHSRRVRKLALAIGRELGLASAELGVLGQAALFHDVGKLAVPDAILLKPDRLDADEWPLMRRHAEEGARIIDRLGFLADAVPAVRHHHERFDGAGYPAGLRGEEIPLGARIIHVADAVDSMLTARSYRAALPASEVVRELRLRAGTQFCPRCVAALERVLAPTDRP